MRALAFLSFAACYSGRDLALPSEEGFGSVVLLVDDRSEDRTLAVMSEAGAARVPITVGDDATLEALLYRATPAELGVPLGVVTDVEGGRPLPAPEAVEGTVIASGADTGWTPKTASDLSSGLRVPRIDPAACGCVAKDAAANALCKTACDIPEPAPPMPPALPASGAPAAPSCSFPEFSFPGTCRRIGSPCPAGTFPDLPPGVVYVSSAAAPPGIGTRADPFTTLAAAIQAGASTIAVAGDLRHDGFLAPGTTLIGSCVERATVRGILSVLGGFSVRDLTIAGNIELTGTLDARGVRVIDGAILAGSSTLVLEDVALTDSHMILTDARSTISGLSVGSTLAGVTCSGGDLSMSDAAIAVSEGGALAIVEGCSAVVDGFVLSTGASAVAVTGTSSARVFRGRIEEAPFAVVVDVEAALTLAEVSMIGVGRGADVEGDLELYDVAIEASGIGLHVEGSVVGERVQIGGGDYGVDARDRSTVVLTDLVATARIRAISQPFESAVAIARAALESEDTCVAGEVVDLMDATLAGCRIGVDARELDGERLSVGAPTGLALVSGRIRDLVVASGGGVGVSVEERLALDRFHIRGASVGIAIGGATVSMQDGTIEGPGAAFACRPGFDPSELLDRVALTGVRETCTDP